MTIAESLAALNALIQGTFALQSYNLAIADVLVWLYNAPNLGEQQISISLQERRNLLERANKIYGLYEDEEATGGVCGFVGESFNG
jgi:hypothetical protein